MVHPLTIGLFTFVSDSRVTVKHQNSTAADTWCLTVATWQIRLHRRYMVPDDQ